ncbi:glycosyltransferase family 2 protein [Candidatus Daviesbacteria bacterium]|nr:glycosyltransferase family 2 protein [Candidatus Daviesbacteria bacterium]
MNSDLSVIILSYNTKEITHHCLQKLDEAKKYCEQKLHNKIEVMVVDNGSQDGSPLMIKEDHPEVKLLALKENTGFSRGNNIGMKESKYDFILLLNSDVYLEVDSLYKALAYFRVNLNCDVLGCKLKYTDGRLQPSAGNLPNFLNTIFWIMGISAIPALKRVTHPFHPTLKSFFAKAHQAGWITGAFFMLKREVFEKTQGFDENLFLYMEEVEWCKRIQDRGFKIWYNPNFEVTHLKAASSDFDPNLALVNELKGLKYYFNKHSSIYFLIKIFLILGLILRVITFTLLGKTKRAKAYVDGLSMI